jgi:GAF domain-containing protein
LPDRALDLQEYQVERESASAEPERPRSDGPHDSNEARPTTSVHSDVVARLAELSRELQVERTLAETMQVVVDAAVGAVPAADAGGIAELRPDGPLDVRYATDPLVERVAAVQSELGIGPSFDAAYDRISLRIDDLGNEPRWAAFAERVRASAGSLLAYRLWVPGRNVAVLSLYAKAPRAFDDNDERTGLLFATLASIALSGARRADQLRGAIDSRDAIGQAKGVLMERFKLSADEAFSVLRQASMDSNLLLRDVARRVTEDEDVAGLRVDDGSPR